MSTESEVQRLPVLHLTECDRCHNRVNFRFVASKPMSDPSFRICYLRCPVCGASASQVTEREILTGVIHKATARRHFKYKK